MGIAEKRWHGYDNGLLFLLVHFFREGVFIEKKKRGNREKSGLYRQEESQGVATSQTAHIKKRVLLVV